MIFYLLFFVFILILAGINNQLSKKFLYPPLFLCFISFFLILLHFIFFYFLSFKPNKLSGNTLGYIFLINLFFSTGGLIAKGLIKDQIKQPKKYYFNEKLINIFVFFNISILFLYLLKIKKITGDFFNLKLFRYYTSIENVNLGLIKYGVFLSIFMSIIVYIHYLNKSKRYNISCIIMFFLTLFLTFLTGSRGYIFFFILSCLGVYSIYRTINVTLLLKIIFGLMISFVFIATVLNKSTPNDYSGSFNYTKLEKAEFFLYSYATLPLSAFDEFYNQPIEITYGDVLFRFPKTVLNKLKIIKSEPTKLVEKYVSVPDRVNVFTAFYKIIKDFGILYSFLFVLIVGYLHSSWFFKANRDIQYVIGFAILMFPLGMIFFEENYLSILSTWIQFFIYIKLLKRFIKIRHE